MVGSMGMVGAFLLLGNDGPPRGEAELPPSRTAAVVTVSGEPAALAPDFLLSTADGERIPLRERALGRVATVVGVVGSSGAIADRYAERLGDLEREYSSEGIRFLGLCTNPEICAGDPDADTLEAGRIPPGKVEDWTSEHGIDFPLLLDPYGAAAKQLCLDHVGEVAVVDAGYRLVYRGAIDDQYSLDGMAEFAREKGLVDTLESLLAQEAGLGICAEPNTPALEFAVTGTRFEKPNYRRDVAPILEQQCVVCHRTGRIGPMELTNYAEVRGWAPMIGEVVEQRRMPPWHAEPGFGEFANARRLTETEKEILVAWAASGAVEGDRAANAATDSSNEESLGSWLIGVPDRVVQLPEPQPVPATGVVDYRWVEVDPGFEVDHWVSAVEIRPSAPDVTHHVLVLLLPPGMTLQSAFAKRDFLTSTGHFAVNVPGAGPAVFQSGYGMRVQAGSRFVFQLHYTPSGVARVDQTQMALRFADESTIDHEVKSRAILNTALNIPPETADVSFTADYAFQRDVTLLALFPHMHARGAAFRFDLQREDRLATLLDVPNYDFNWQHTYWFREPVPLHSGDELHLTAVYDNSADNPLNPDSAARVYWGDQTWEEMLVGYVTYVEGRAGAEAD